MELDSEEVLHHLKALGYENVERHLLQKFIIDLKKLIKYERKNSEDNEKKNVNTNLNSANKCLFNEQKLVLSTKFCKNACCNNKNNDVFERLSRPSSKTKLCSKAVTTVGVQTDSRYNQTKGKNPILKRKQMDPVSLHHYYQTEWLNHKIPGEKNHDQLRWKVRQMMIHK